jgi:hypothetical protein
MARDGEHFFMCFLSHLDYFLRKVSVQFSSFASLIFGRVYLFELLVYSGYQSQHKELIASTLMKK